jgi:lipoprotein NlpI
MLLSATTGGVAQIDAQRLLQDRWARVDRTTWDKRLQEGDRQAWYEMLLGYFTGTVQKADIFDPLRDNDTFAASKLAKLQTTRQRLLTEAYFYDAVRLMAAGDNAGATASLQQVKDNGTRLYVEYDMAVHLLRKGVTRPARRAETI